ncbi:MAG TPA: sigma-70 family RNA polymerase sigma factor [Opitutaceae bacterium]
MHDTALLRRYADTGSDDAFAALVESYLPLVYGAALRKVGGDTHLAQDVAQLAFVALAREAPRLREHPDLAGWLFTSTRFLAANAVRSERRRRAREAVALADPSDIGLHVGAGARMQAMLDDVLMELQQLDRQILLLRFYRGLRLAEIGAQINSTENAVQKRLERALERLRERFARIGITSAAAALMAALESHGAVAVPAGFKAGAITAGLAAGGGGVVATTTAGLSATAKWALGAVAAAAVVCSVALVWSRRENDRLRAELAGDTLEEGGVASLDGAANPRTSAARSAQGDSTAASRTKRPSSAAKASSEGLVPLVVDYPRPLFAGTPQPIWTPNLEAEPPTVPVMVPLATRLLSHDKPVTSSDPMPVIGALSFITDGDKSSRDDAYVELSPGLQWVQIDLGQIVDIDAVVVWHFHAQRRVYHDVVIQASADPAFTRPVTVFNNDSDNSARLRENTAAYNQEYIETHLGRAIWANAAGRYVRLYSNGNTSDKLNHYCEVQVFGRP